MQGFAKCWAFASFHFFYTTAKTGISTYTEENINTEENTNTEENINSEENTQTDGHTGRAKAKTKEIS